MTYPFLPAGTVPWVTWVSKEFRPCDDALGRGPSLAEAYSDSAKGGAGIGVRRTVLGCLRCWGYAGPGDGDVLAFEAKHKGCEERP